MNATKIGKFKQLVKMVCEADFLSSIGETIMECGSRDQTLLKQWFVKRTRRVWLVRSSLQIIILITYQSIADYSSLGRLVGGVPSASAPSKANRATGGAIAKA